MSDSTSDYLWLNDEINNLEQIIPRRYTLIHHYDVPDLFLCINEDFMYKTLISNRFKLLGEWTTYDKKKYLFYIYIDVDLTPQAPSLHHLDIVMKELPRLIQVIKYGDCDLFNLHPQLLDSSIYLFIHSSDIALDSIKYFGSFSDFN